MIVRDCPIECVTPAEGQWFVGYYDKQPWSPDGARLLVHRARIRDRAPTERDIVDLGAVDLRSPERPFTTFARSTLWNWQQGAMLQWLPGAGDTVLYNVRTGDEGARGLAVWQFGAAIVHNLATGARRALDRPVYCLAPSGAFALSLSFARLAATRPDYGHAGVDDPTVEELTPADDGVWRIDVPTGAARLILPISRIAAHSEVPFGRGRRHWVNHLMVNPSSNRFCFLHRFWRDDGNLHTRLFTAAADGADLTLVLEGMVSHFDWQGDRTLLAWAGERCLLAPSRGPARRVKSLALRSLKPIYYAMGKPRFLMSRVVRDSYMLLHDDGRHHERFARGALTVDGHCTLSPDRRWVLTDGYTDRRSRLPLFLYDTRSARATRVGLYPTPRELDGPVRCDLHPRFSRDATRVCIDSAMDGSRRVYLVDVSSVTGGAR